MTDLTRFFTARQLINRDDIISIGKTRELVNLLRRSESAAGQREFLRRCCREPIPVQTEDYVGDTINAAKALIHDNYYLRL